MNHLADRLSEQLEQLADSAQVRRDLDRVIADASQDGAPVASSRRHRRTIAQVAAAIIVIAGVAAVIAFEGSPATHAPASPATTPASAAPTPASSTPSADTTDPAPTEPAVAVHSQAELMRVLDDVAVEEHVEMTDAGSATWRVTGWTGRTVGLPSVWCLRAGQGGGSCRTDGEEMDDELKRLVFSGEGTIVLADAGVASVEASADGAPVEVGLVDIGLPSGRRLVAVGFDGIADELVLTGLDAAGNTIATVVHDVAELRQADTQRETKDEEIQAATELAMAAPPTILASPEPAVSTGTIQVRVASTASVAIACVGTVGTDSGTSCFEPVATADDQGPRLISYGGTPVSNLVVWSPTRFNGIEAVLANGQQTTAAATETELGWFAAFAYPESNPPQSLLASTTDGSIDLAGGPFDHEAIGNVTVDDLD